jgi:hypothetical protein
MDTLLCRVCNKELPYETKSYGRQFICICLGDLVYEDGNYMACSYECLEK